MRVDSIVLLTTNSSSAIFSFYNKTNIERLLQLLGHNDIEVVLWPEISFGQLITEYDYDSAKEKMLLTKFGEHAVEVGIAKRWERNPEHCVFLSPEEIIDKFSVADMQRMSKTFMDMFIDEQPPNQLFLFRGGVYLEDLTLLMRNVSSQEEIDYYQNYLVDVSAYEEPVWTQMELGL